MTETVLDVVRDLLEEVDEADADGPGAHDFYVRVGARWADGRFDERLRSALQKHRYPCSESPSGVCQFLASADERFQCFRCQWCLQLVEVK